jgi:hypothetical protein
MAGTRVVQWTAGAVARHSVKSVLERPAVDAIPFVVSGPPGSITYADLPPITSRVVPKA